MNNEVKFVDGLRAFKPHANAPEFVKAALEINIDELKQWLNKQGSDKVRLDLKESKSGTYYCSVNTFVPDASRSNGGQSQQSQSSQGASNGDFGPPPSDDFEDEIPF